MRKRNFYYLLLMLLPLIIGGSCAGDNPLVDNLNQEGKHLLSVSVDVAPIGISTRSITENDVLSSGMAARAEAGQSMSIELNGKSASYIYDGKTWIPETDPLTFSGNGQQNIKITLNASNSKQNGTLKGLLAADNLIYEGSVAPSSEIKNITLVHSKMLLEFEPDGVTPENSIVVAGETAYYNQSKGIYLLVLDSNQKNVDISYTNQGQAVAYTMGLSSGLESNWVYRVKITEKGAELQLADAIESVTATINGIAGLNEVIEEFSTRAGIGQTMTVSLGNNSAKYKWNGSSWIPQSTPLKYPQGMRHSIDIGLACEENVVQDGTEAAFLKADKLYFQGSNLLRLSDLTGVTFTRVMGFVHLSFKTDEQISQVSVDGVKAVKVSDNNFKVILEPCSKQLSVTFTVKEKTLTQKSQHVEVKADNAVALEVELSEPSEDIDYAIDDLGLPKEMAGAKGHGPIVKIMDGSYKVFMQDPTNTATIKTVTETGALDVYPSNPANRFRVGLHNTISTEQWKFEKPNKILVATDLHGEFDALVDILKSQNVIDDHFNWTFGQNFLIVNGDAVHRGRDEVPILWLLYKLEAQAEHHGGKCIYLTANHDDWLLQKSNTSFRHSENKKFYENLVKVEKGVIKSYEDLFEDTYVLGKWLRQRNSVVVIGSDAYVHAGIGKRMVENNFSIPKINEIAKRNIGLSSSSRDKEGKEVFNSSTSSGGTYWLRTMINGSMKEPELTSVLNYYNIDRVICGHTEVDDVSWLYNGRVIGVNVKHKTNWENRFKATWTKKTSAAMLIEGINYYMVDYNGNKSLIGQSIR